MTHVYFDTDVFRLFGEAFLDQPLEDRLRRRILVSPMSCLEVMSQLVTKEIDAIQAQIRAMQNWMPNPPMLLPIPTHYILKGAFSLPIPTLNDIYSAIDQAVGRCVSAPTASVLQPWASKVRDFLDAWRDRSANDFASLLEFYRNAQRSGHQLTDSQLRKTLQDGLAVQVGVDPKNPLADGLPHYFAAFFEYEITRTKIALANKEYNPLSEKNKNDLIDSLQLLYLGDRNNVFLTCDKRYTQRVTECGAASRIRTFRQDELSNATAAEAILSELI